MDARVEGFQQGVVPPQPVESVAVAGVTVAKAGTVKGSPRVGELDQCSKPTGVQRLGVACNVKGAGIVCLIHGSQLNSTCTAAAQVVV